MLTILGTLKRRSRNATRVSQWPPHADVVLWTNGSEFLTYLYEWTFCSVDTTVVCESFVTNDFAVLLVYRLLWQILFPKLFDLCVILINTKVDNTGSLCGHIKIHCSGSSAGLLQREGKYSRIGLTIADILFHQ